VLEQLKLSISILDFTLLVARFSLHTTDLSELCVLEVT